MQKYFSSAFIKSLENWIGALANKFCSLYRHLRYRGTYRDRQLTQKAILRLLGSEPLVILELGAADGNDTNAFLACLSHPDSRVYAFEPDKRNVLSFQRNVKDSRAILIQKAIGPYTGEGNLHVSSTIYSSSIRMPNEELLRSHWPEISFEAIEEIEFITLDDAAKALDLSQIDFIWADVQGAEGDLISAGGQTLAKTRYFYTEYSNFEFYEGALTLENLKGHLGVNWHLAQDYGSDALFRNELFKELD